MLLIFFSTHQLCFKTLFAFDITKHLWLCFVQHDIVETEALFDSFAIKDDALVASLIESANVDDGDRVVPATIIASRMHG